MEVHRIRIYEQEKLKEKGGKLNIKNLNFLIHPHSSTWQLVKLEGGAVNGG